MLLQESNLTTRQPRRVSYHVIQATTVEEWLAQSPYLAAWVGFEPATLRIQGAYHRVFVDCPWNVFLLSKCLTLQLLYLEIRPSYVIVVVILACDWCTTLEGKGNKDIPRLRWIDNINEDMTSLGLTLKGEINLTNDWWQWQSFIRTHHHHKWLVSVTDDVDT